MPGIIDRWLGADGHDVDRRTGRPKAADSWRSLTIGIWTSWFWAFGMIVLAVIYSREWGADRKVVILTSLVPIIAIANFVRMRSLRRKKARMRASIAAHDAGLAKAFAELEDDLREAVHD